MDIYAETGERHVQVNDFHVDNTEGYHTFWQNLLDQYEGYEIDFCYHNCKVPVGFMNEIGAVFMESCIETTLVKENFTPVRGFEATLVTGENFTAFAALHDRTNPNMYWTSKKISRDFSRWRIYMHRETYVMMSLWSDVAEIFALEATDTDDSAGLLSAAIAFAFETGKTGVLMMADETTSDQMDAVRLVGFKKCGRYMAYRAVVKPFDYTKRQETLYEDMTMEELSQKAMEYKK